MMPRWGPFFAFYPENYPESTLLKGLDPSLKVHTRQDESRIDQEHVDFSCLCIILTALLVLWRYCESCERVHHNPLLPRSRNPCRWPAPGLRRPTDAAV
jgi:hypothetical protein